MKRQHVVLAAVAASCALALGACGTGNTTEIGGSDDDVPLIGIAMKTAEQARWHHEVAVMERIAAEQGAEVIVQWANDDITRQGNQYENLMSQGVDALITVPVNDRVGGSYLQTLRDEGIPIVAYDLLPQDLEVDYFVTRDNRAVGVEQARAALEYIGDDTANIALLKGDAANMVAQGIAAGYDDVLADATNLTVVADQWIPSWSTEGALSLAENTLSAHNDDVTAFIAGTDGLAMGVVQAVRGRGLEGEVFVSGLDVEPANAQLIAEGVQTMSIWTDLDDHAETAINAAIQLARGEVPEADDTTSNGGPEVPTGLAQVVPIYREDLCRFIHEIAPEGWITEEEVFATTEVPEDCGEQG
ncbi:substrate-binding domain-containing protein [Ruania zhangjianzhongii]|uniref:substrate-binding domain-containing protein n=1 Tax=Ruania zhangjianzhongii TaxID=2603206 RepID=UPI0011CBD56F|nr:substrate-binding domain-containing protein [Ruania zhangjianzhongii]